MGKGKQIRQLNTLNDAQQSFVESYLLNGGNATSAYRFAYPKAHGDNKSIASRASRLARLPKVARLLDGARVVSEAAVQSAVERYAITAERLADAMARLALTDLRQVCDVTTEVEPSTGKERRVLVVKDFKDIDDDAHQAIVGVKRAASGAIEVQLADKRAAIMDLARLKGWIADKPVDNRQLVMLKIER